MSEGTVISSNHLEKVALTNTGLLPKYVGGGGPAFGGPSPFPHVPGTIIAWSDWKFSVFQHNVQKTLQLFRLKLKLHPPETGVSDVQDV